MSDLVLSVAGSDLDPTHLTMKGIEVSLALSGLVFIIRDDEDVSPDLDILPTPGRH